MPDRSDLTGRARVRDAALAEFADHGVGGASIRSVAARAEVSPGLVQHHFGTKEALRRACDAYVVDYVRRAVVEVAGARVGATDGLVALQVEARPVMRYLGRALVDGSSAAATLFDELVGVTEAYLRQLADPPPAAALHDRAVVLTAMRLSSVVLGDLVAQEMGPDGVRGRISAATVALLHPDLLPADARAGVDAAITELTDTEEADEP